MGIELCFHGDVRVRRDSYLVADSIIQRGFWQPGECLQTVLVEGILFDLGGDETKQRRRRSLEFLNR
jgi:hypothetical protein